MAIWGLGGVRIWLQEQNPNKWRSRRGQHEHNTIAVAIQLGVARFDDSHCYYRRFWRPRPRKTSFSRRSTNCDEHCHQYFIFFKLRLYIRTCLTWKSISNCFHSRQWSNKNPLKYNRLNRNQLKNIFNKTTSYYLLLSHSKINIPCSET